ncbi:MAG: RNA polymerase sigma-70 factor [Chlorobi bacterium]|nr:RNA polymerase sigma-70 factor [Chlorobiota bacterium]
MEQDFILYKLKKGDKDSFNYIFNKHYREMVLFAIGFVEDRDKAEDIVQSVFLKLWENRNKININISLRSYLFKTVQNKCLDLIKHTNVKNKAKEDIIANTQAFSEDNIASYDLIEKLEESINTLPDTVKRIFTMSRFEDKKYKEIAQELSISVKTVEANIGKALKILRENLKDWL